MSVTCTSSATCGTCENAGNGTGVFTGKYLPAQFTFADAFSSAPAGPTPMYDTAPSGIRPDTVFTIPYSGGLGGTTLSHNDVFQILQNFQRADGTENTDPDVTPWAVIYLTDAYQSETVPVVCPLESNFRTIDTSTTPLNMILQYVPTSACGLVLLPIHPVLAAGAPFLTEFVNTANTTNGLNATSVMGFGTTFNYWGFVPVNINTKSIDGSCVIVNTLYEPNDTSDPDVVGLPIVATQEVNPGVNAGAWSVMTFTNQDKTSWCWNNVQVPKNPTQAYNLGVLANTDNSTNYDYMFAAKLNYQSTAIFRQYNYLEFTTYDSDTGNPILWQGTLSYYASWGSGDPSTLGYTENFTGENAIPCGTMRQCFQGLYPGTCYGVVFQPTDPKSGNVLPAPAPFPITFYMPTRYWIVPQTYSMTSLETIPKGINSGSDGEPMNILVSARQTTTGGANIYYFSTLSPSPPGTGSENVINQSLQSESIKLAYGTAHTVLYVFIGIGVATFIFMIVALILKFRKAPAPTINVEAPKAV